MKQKKFLRHHWFLVCVFAVIILLAIVAFILQRSTNLDVIAGKAIRQQIDETKQLALSDEAVKIATAVKLGQKQVFMSCPQQLLSNEQHWKIPASWSVQPLNVVNLQCFGSVMWCIYANKELDLVQPGHLIISKSFSDVEKCVAAREPNYGCNCDIKS